MDNVYQVQKTDNVYQVPKTDNVYQVQKTDKVVIDKAVVLGHIVPGLTIFERAARDPRRQMKSMAFNGELEVYLSVENITNPSTNKVTC